MLSSLKKVYNKLLFIQKSHFLLHRVTLHVNDPTIAEKILVHRNYQFNKLFFGITTAVAIRLIVLVISYFTTGGYLPFVRVASGCLDLSFCILWLILRICHIKKGLTILTPLYMTTQCILANLSLRNMFPEMLKESE